jgi:EF-hand domain-containing protein 1
VNTSNNVLFKPNFSKADRHVLRLFGFFKESVSESNLETERVRRLIINIYLVDNTISINEEKQLNSGIPQGSFLSRQNVPHHTESNRFVNAWDFRVGEYTQVFGKKVFVYNIDEYTRKFYEQNGRPQPQPASCEQDSFSTNVLPTFASKAWNGLNSSF